MFLISVANTLVLMVSMNGVDAIVFTAGLGENNGEARKIFVLI